MTNPIFTTHHELRRSVSINCSSPKLTDQSAKNQCDINNIMRQFMKTGEFSHLNKSQPQYLDTTLIPTLEDAFSIVSRASQLFSELPATIRKLIDHDPSKLESFISNPKNREILLQNGLIIDNSPKSVETLPKSDPPPVG